MAEPDQEEHAGGVTFTHEGAPLVRVTRGRVSGQVPEPARLEVHTIDGWRVAALFFRVGSGPKVPDVRHSVELRTGTYTDAVEAGRARARDLIAWRTVDNVAGGGIH